VTERMRLMTATVVVGILGAGFWYASATAPASIEAANAGEIEAAAGAVRAWGSFATTGDITRLSGWFATEGPQYSQLQKEFADLVPGGRYEFSLSEAEVVKPGLVRGSVTVTDEGGSHETYRWDIELIKEGGRWRVWTVRTSP
jgi:hypothetical protein